MELLTAVILACGIAFIGCLCFLGGCAVSLELAKRYKRDATEAVAAAEAKAYADHIRALRESYDAKMKVENGDISLQPQQREDDFEEGLANLYPNDPELQEAMRKKRLEAKLQGR